MIKLKRAYSDPAKEDGYRVLVDRLWPRGIAREKLKIDTWLKELAPSQELRQWFGHDPEKWTEFKERYFQELDHHSGAIEQLAERARQGRVTLVYAAKNEEYNNAVALKEYVERILAS